MGEGLYVSRTGRTNINSTPRLLYYKITNRIGLDILLWNLVDKD